MRCCQESLLQLQSAHQPWPSFSSICFPIPSPSCRQRPQIYSATYQIWTAAPPACKKKMHEYQPAPGFTCFGIIPPEPPLYWFLFHFLPAAESEAVLCLFWPLFHSFDHVFQQTVLLRVAKAALWLAAGEVYAPNLIKHLDRCLEETPELSLQLCWNGMNELLRQHWLRGAHGEYSLIIITGEEKRMTTGKETDGQFFS